MLLRITGPAIALAVFGLVTISCAQNEAISVAEQIHAANGRFIEAVRTANAAAMPALYTKDAQILPPNGDVVSGEEAIAAFWRNFVELGIRDARPVTLEVIPMGELAVEVGTYSLHSPDGTLIDRGKIMVVWKQEEGTWKMHRDMWNSSLPPSDPGADQE